MQALAGVDLRRRSFITIKFSRNVPHALAYKQLTKLVHAMFCCLHFYCVRVEPHCRHESTVYLTTRTGQSKRDILIHYVLLSFRHFKILTHSRKYWKQSTSLRVSKLCFRVSKDFSVSKTQSTTVSHCLLLYYLQ